MEKLSKPRYLAKEAGQVLLNPRFIGPCLAGVFCLIVATVVGVSYLFTMAMAILAMPVAGYAVGTILMRHSKTVRKPRIYAVQGERVLESIRISRSLGTIPTAIVASDTLPKHIEGEDDPEIEILSEHEAEARIWIRPMKRGLHAIGPLEVIAYEPLGMLRIKRKIGERSEILVYPRPIRIDIGRPSSGIREFGSAHSSGRLSDQGEFAGVREYRSGDEIKRIHWKTTARSRKLAVVEYEDCTTGPVTIAVDLSDGCDFGRGIISSLDVAVSAAAYAVEEHLKAGRPVRLLIPGESTVSRVHLSCIEDLDIALTMLAKAQGDSKVSAAELVKSCDRQEDSILLITTRGGDELAAAIEGLSTQGTLAQIALIDSEPFAVDGNTEAEAASLRRAGANVEIVREDAWI